MVSPAVTPPIPAPNPAPLPPAPESLTRTGAELLEWRRRLLARGGAAADLDWLLDLGGGLRWSQLQALRCQPLATIRLDRPL